MDKKEFENLVVPLSEKEKRYRDDPQQAEQTYAALLQLAHGSGVPIIAMNPALQAQGHAQLMEGATHCSVYQNLAFSKQTRYSRVPLHRHNCIEMFYVYAGHCIVVLNDSRIELLEGDVCIMDTGCTHTIHPLAEKDIVLNCMMEPSYFTAGMIGRLASSGTVAQFLAEVLNHSSKNRYLLFHTKEFGMVREAFENAFCEYLDPGLCSPDILDSYMTQIFILLARCYQSNREKEYRTASRTYLTQVLRHIEVHCCDPNCTLKAVAHQFNFNPQYLSRAMKEETGFSFKDLLDQNRLMRAAFLLQNTALPVEQIAHQCGWSNTRQFYKKFQDGYGLNPGEYRRREENSPS